MTMPYRYPEKCRVIGCKRVAETTWEPDMRPGVKIPVCWHHFKSRLWWYRGWIFCRDEEPQ
jgi:hypothetical protein